MKRRSSLLLTASALGGSLLGYAGLIEPTQLRLRKETLIIPNLPKAFDGLKIAQLTDFHYRPFFDTTLIEKSVLETLKFKPDLIALTGDFIERCPTALNPLLQLLSPLEAPSGVFAILGNHDHYGFSRAELKEAFSDRNIQLLVNQTVNYPYNGDQYIQIVGLDSAYAGSPKFDLHAPQSSENQLRLLLAHEPDVFVKASESYNAHLQLSGHTHGGQCRIPFFNMPIITPPLGRIYIDGFYAEGDNRLFVSSGIGTSGIRIRFCCPPEVALLTLQAES